MSDDDLALPEEPVVWKPKGHILRMKVSREWVEAMRADEEWMDAQIQKIIKEEIFKEFHDD